MDRDEKTFFQPVGQLFPRIKGSFTCYMDQVGFEFRDIADELPEREIVVFDKEVLDLGFIQVKTAVASCKAELKLNACLLEAFCQADSVGASAVID